MSVFRRFVLSVKAQHPPQPSDARGAGGAHLGLDLDELTGLGAAEARPLVGDLPCRRVDRAPVQKPIAGGRAARLGGGIMGGQYVKSHIDKKGGNILTPSKEHEVDPKAPSRE